MKWFWTVQWVQEYIVIDSWQYNKINLIKLRLSNNSTCLFMNNREQLWTWFIFKKLNKVVGDLLLFGTKVLGAFVLTIKVNSKMLIRKIGMETSPQKTALLHDKSVMSLVFSINFNSIFNSVPCWNKIMLYQ